MKNVIANILYYTGISWLCFFFSRIVYGPHIRVVNYHGTPSSLKKEFDRQLRWFARWYCDVNEDELKSFLFQRKWEKSKPGLILSFDDGKRNNYDVARELVEDHGFTGWFFVPAGWVIASNDEQHAEQGGDSDLIAEYGNERLIVNQEELCKLAERHVVGCHTFTHHRMKASDDTEVLRREIIESKFLLERLLGAKQNIFCWVGGEEIHYTKEAADLIASAGYEFSFTTNTLPVRFGENPLKLERTNIEVFNSIPLVLFQVSGLMDLFYFAKRRRLSGIFTKNDSPHKSSPTVGMNFE